MKNQKEKIIEDFTKKLLKVNTSFRQFIQCRFKKNGIDLTYEMLQVLGCLWIKDGINQQEIANLTVKDKASITYLIDNLTKRRLVYRTEDGIDRRNKLIMLTVEGKEFRKTIQPIVNELYVTAGLNLDIESISQIMILLDKVEANLTG